MLLLQAKLPFQTMPVLCALLLIPISTLGTNTANAQLPPVAEQEFTLPASDNSTTDNQQDFFNLFTPGQRKSVDASATAVSANVGSLARYLDSFFADERISEYRQTSALRLKGGLSLNSEGELSFLPEGQLNLSLPQAKNRVGLIVSSFQDKESTKDSVNLDDDQKSEAVFAGLRFLILDSPYHQVNFDTGLRFRPKPDPETRLRYTTAIPVTTNWTLRPAQTFFWKLEEEFGEVTRFDLERPLTDERLVRNRLFFTWSEETIEDERDVRFDNELSLFTTPTTNSATRWSLGIEGDTGLYGFKRYYGAYLYRRAIYRRILFSEIEPKLYVDKEDDFEPIAQITFGLEIIFSEETTANDLSNNH